LEEGARMSQLRLDPMTGRWVVIAGERAERRDAFRQRSLEVEADPGRPCPFCNGRDDVGPPALESYGPGGQWEVRVVPNRYPAFGGTEPMVVSHLGPVFTQAPASGIHEVFVLTPDHNSSWADLTEAHAALVMDALQDRMTEHAGIPGLRYSQAVVNRGREAGASMTHPHGQLLSMPFVPGEISSEMAGFGRFKGNCILCATIDAEEQVGHRTIHADDRVFTMCPFWSGTPYEMIVLPRQHGPHLFRADRDDLAAVGRSIQIALAALRAKLGDVAYNIMFHSAPYRVMGDYHWHVHIVPKVTTRGGFELGSGVLINVVAPEQAASELRSCIGALA
ncbi:MAG: galactose-1-phosphate uridylyltransferase, partial [Acidimicrobiales bacterium]